MTQGRSIKSQQDEALRGATGLRELFVGRERELGAAVRAVENALAGRGFLLLVHGEPGIGKSRLADEVAGYASSRGMRTLCGRCWEGEGASAYWPWEQVVRSYARTVDPETCLAALGPEPSRITRVLPGIAQWIRQVPVNAELDETPAARFRFYDAFHTFLSVLSASQPTLIVLDDLHSADDSSVLLLQFVANQVSNIPLGIVATYRDADVHPRSVLAQVLSASSRHSWVKRIPLLGLTVPEVSRLLEFVIGQDLNSALSEAIHQRTDGNPFFLHELAAFVANDSASIGFTDANWQSVLPHTIREMILGELASLPVECRTVLNTAAVVGRDFDLRLLASVQGDNTATIDSLLSDAVAKRIIFPLRQTTYRFRHALVREIIYDTLGAQPRSEIHLNIAGVLSRYQYPSAYSTSSMLAHHYYMALPLSEVTDAMSTGLRAGAEAQRRLAYEEAMMQFKRGLDLARLNGHQTFECVFLNSLGEAQAGIGLWAESRAMFLCAAELATDLGNRCEFARAAIGLKGKMGATFPIDTDAVALLRLAANSDLDDDRLLIRVLSALSKALYFGNMRAELEAHSQLALSLARDVGDEELSLVALDAYITGLWGPTRVDEVAGRADELLARAAAVNNKEIAFNARLYRYYCQLTTGRFSESLIELGHAERLASETRNVRCSWQVPMIRAARVLVRGEFDESERLSNEGFRLGSLVHDSSPTHHHMVQTFQRARLRGEYADLDGIMALAGEAFPEVVGYRAALALYLVNRGEKNRARSILREASARAFSVVGVDILTLWTLGVFAEAAYLCGEGEWNRLLYDRLIGHADQYVVMGWGSAFDGAVSHYLALLASTLGETDMAVQHFECAVSANGFGDCVPLLARTRYFYAETLLKSNENLATARGLLEECTSEFSRFGMTGFLRRSCERLQTVREQVPAINGSRRTVRDGATERYVFRREVDFWTIVYDEKVLRLRNSFGLSMIRALLEQPETDIHALDLVGFASPPEPQERNPESSKSSFKRGLTMALGDSGPLLDERAKADYQERASDLRDELIEAQRCNDIGRIERIREELEAIEGELSRAYGRRGVVRVAGAASERARVRVRNNITAALTKIRRDGGEALFRHLDAAIRTGMVCSYRPERPIPWEF